MAICRSQQQQRVTKDDSSELRVANGDSTDVKLKSDERSKKRCWKCSKKRNKELRLKKCSRCRLARYCSELCYNEDKESHKHDCNIEWNRQSSSERVQCANEKAKNITQEVDSEASIYTDAKKSEEFEEIDPGQFRDIELKDRNIGERCWRCSKRKSKQICLMWCPKCRMAKYCSDKCLNEH